MAVKTYWCEFCVKFTKGKSRCRWYSNFSEYGCGKYKEKDALCDEDTDTQETVYKFILKSKSNKFSPIFIYNKEELKTKINSYRTDNGINSDIEVFSLSQIKIEIVPEKLVIK